MLFLHLRYVSGNVSSWRVGLCYGENPGNISQWLLFSCQNHERIFLQPSPGESSGFLEVKPTTLYGSLKLQPQDFFTLTSPHSISSNSSKLPFKCSYQFMAPVDSISGKQVSIVSLNFSVSPHFVLMVYPMTFVLWWVQEKPGIFHFFGLFLL